jgi:hypothetical protein
MPVSRGRVEIDLLEILLFNLLACVAALNILCLCSVTAPTFLNKQINHIQ